MDKSISPPTYHFSSILFTKGTHYCKSSAATNGVRSPVYHFIQQIETFKEIASLLQKFFPTCKIRVCFSQKRTEIKIMQFLWFNSSNVQKIKENAKRQNCVPHQFLPVYFKQFAFCGKIATFALCIQKPSKKAAVENAAQRKSLFKKVDLSS